MRQTIFAVFLSGLLWPGLGQLYNRDFLKGFVLIGLTLLFGLSLFLGAGLEIANRLPADLSTFDMTQARALSQELLKSNSGFFFTFNLLTMITWLYAVVDAYLGAKERLSPPTPTDEPPPADDSDSE
ncbi:MAG TPA: hypothetical protein P5079_05930 [Elusimicrobiota bacterium]|nr:hypothetical protein [Elusimicrobiota bacterium]